MNGITEGVLRSLPALTQNSSADPLVYLRFVQLGTGRSWLATEGQQQNTQFQFWGVKVKPTGSHWGYFTLEELEDEEGPDGEVVARDMNFAPARLSVVLPDAPGQTGTKSGVDTDMGVNRALNAVIAMLEDRPKLFKELLRAPGSDVQNATEVETRLRQAIDRYAATQIRTGLMRTLHVMTPGEPAGEVKQVFFDGVRAVEEVFETLADELDGNRA